jgi:hypothetical protein
MDAVAQIKNQTKKGGRGKQQKRYDITEYFDAGGKLDLVKAVLAPP